MSRSFEAVIVGMAALCLVVVTYVDLGALLPNSRLMDIWGQDGNVFRQKWMVLAGVMTAFVWLATVWAAGHKKESGEPALRLIPRVILISAAVLWTAHTIWDGYTGLRW